jgi:hypothetical protein
LEIIANNLVQSVAHRHGKGIIITTTTQTERNKMKVSDIIINNGEEFRIEVVGATREEMVNGELVEGTHVFGEYVNKMRMTKGGKKSIRCGLFIITEGAA